MTTADRRNAVEVHILHEKGDGAACDPMCGFTVRQRLTLVATPPIVLDESRVKLPEDIETWDRGPDRTEALRDVKE